MDNLFERAYSKSKILNKIKFTKVIITFWICSEVNGEPIMTADLQAREARTLWNFGQRFR